MDGSEEQADKASADPDTIFNAVEDKEKYDKQWASHVQSRIRENNARLRAEKKIEEAHFEVSCDNFVSKRDDVEVVVVLRTRWNIESNSILQQNRIGYLIAILKLNLTGERGSKIHIPSW